MLPVAPAVTWCRVSFFAKLYSLLPRCRCAYRHSVRGGEFSRFFLLEEAAMFFPREAFTTSGHAATARCMDVSLHLGYLRCKTHPPDILLHVAVPMTSCCVRPFSSIIERLFVSVYSSSSSRAAVLALARLKPDRHPVMQTGTKSVFRAAQHLPSFLR